MALRLGSASNVAILLMQGVVCMYSLPVETFVNLAMVAGVIICTLPLYGIGRNRRG